MTQMSPIHTPIAAILVACGLATALVAQVGAPAPASPQEPIRATTDAPQTTFLTGDRILGQRISAAETSTGGAARQPLGTVVDLAMNRRTGAIELYGIKMDGVVRAVPAAAVHWNPQDRAFVCSLDRDGMNRVAVALEGDLRNLRSPRRDERSTAAPAPAVEASAPRHRAPTVTYSALRGQALRRGDTELDPALEPVFEIGSGHIAFLIAEIGGVAGLGSREIPIPYSALESVTPPIEDQDEASTTYWSTQLSDQDLRMRPTLAVPAGLDAPTFRRSVYAAWQVDAPAWEGSRASGEASAAGATDQRDKTPN